MLQIVSHGAIPLLLKYTTTRQFSEKLLPLIPGLGMLFVNKPPDHLKLKELQKLSWVLTNQAHVIYENIIQACSNIICNIHESSPYYQGDWEDTERLRF